MTLVVQPRTALNYQVLSTLYKNCLFQRKVEIIILLAGFKPALAVHGRDFAPLLRDGVEDLDGVQSLCAVVATDGEETVLHDGDADAAAKH